MIDYFELAKLFKVDDKPLELYPTQKKVLKQIITKKHPRNIYLLPTRYGKSMLIALGIIIRLSLFREKWIIAAPTRDQARVIMKKIQKHIGDHIFFKSQLDYDYDKLDKEASKERLTFKKGGEVSIVSADQSNKQRRGDSAMGHGAPNIVCDESELIDDDIFTKIFRMLGDSKDNYLFELGNPLRRNHFYEHWTNPKYNKIKISAWDAVEEGRWNREFIEEQENSKFFKELWLCEWPEEERELRGGWRPLLTRTEINKSFVKSFVTDKRERKNIGMDVGGDGVDDSVWVLRNPYCAKIIGNSSKSDTSALVGRSINLMDRNNVWAKSFVVDAVAVGKGVVDGLKSEGKAIRAAKAGGRILAPMLKRDFRDQKAKWYWHLRKWIKDGGKLVEDERWLELANIHYKSDHKGRVQIMDKTKMLREGFPSPNYADALALTFYGKQLKKPDNLTPLQRRIKEDRKKQTMGRISFK